MIPARVSRLPALLLLAAVPLAGCATRYESYSLSGGAAMRIDVAVYKGPLSVPVSGQIGQMGAVITESIRAAAQWHDGAKALAEQRFKPDSKVAQAQRLAAAISTGVEKLLSKSAQAAQPATLADDLYHQLLQIVEQRPQPADGSARHLASLTRPEVDRIAAGLSARLMLPPDMAKEIETIVEKAVDEKEAKTESERARSIATELRLFDTNLCEAVDKDEYKKTDYADRQTAARDCHVLADSLAIARQSIMAGCRLLSQDETIELLGQPAYLPVNTCTRFGFTRSIYAQDKRLNVEVETREGDKRIIDRASIVTRSDVDTDETIADTIKRVQRTRGGRSDFTEKGTGDYLKSIASPIAIAVDNYATLLRSAGFRTSFGTVRYVPHAPSVRSAVLGLSLITAEYGNQLQGRITTLTRQINDDKSANLLSTADFLRDASNTRFLRMAEWLDGGIGGNPGGMDVADRARLAQSLTSDFYWQPVTSVHGSGRGEVAMAFIKDSIGNWDLKSFSNDPGELLASYRSVADAGIKTALRLIGSAAKAASGPVGGAAEAAAAATARIGLAQRVRSLAEDVSSAQSGDGGSADQVQRLRLRLLGEIETLKTEWQKRPATLAAALEDKKKLLKQDETARNAAKDDVDLKNRAIGAAQTALLNCSSTTPAPPPPGQCDTQSKALSDAILAHDKARTELAAAEAQVTAATQARDAAQKAVDNMEADARAALAALFDKQGAIIAALEDLAVEPEPKPAAPKPAPAPAP
ncbi:MAG: hypothetical protein KGQ52_03195 [Alphaproteobacteria bacterium]|nr:hypothetical protein [Alphaproteobacteria bacterium]